MGRLADDGGAGAVQAGCAVQVDVEGGAHGEDSRSGAAGACFEGGPGPWGQVWVEEADAVGDEEAQAEQGVEEAVRLVQGVGDGPPKPAWGEGPAAGGGPGAQGDAEGRCDELGRLQVLGVLLDAHGRDHPKAPLRKVR